jgi:DNA modification methylase
MIEQNTIICGDALTVLKTLPDCSVQCCVTSPPYWGLRDYGVAGQLGLEVTPEEYVSKMVAIFSEVKRVLMDNGTLWLNLGDSYYNFRGYTDYATKQSCASNEAHIMGTACGKRNAKQENLKGKDLVGIPWMTAFALRTDGWYLRSDIIWHKPNPMPESVTDRCTKSHEYIFLLAKSQKYYYDAEAIKEPNTTGSIERFESGAPRKRTDNRPGTPYTFQQDDIGKSPLNGRNRRSVWTIPTKSYPESHFATFPPDLIKPCILAGCPEGGIVLDPFMGSGTTALVAKNLNRKYLGIELNQKYIALAEKRLAQERLEI